MEKFIKENFDLKSVKKRADIHTLGWCTCLVDHIRNTSLTQDCFARLVGIDPANLSRILNGKCTPSLKMFLRLTQGLSEIARLVEEFQKSKENESDHTV